jgi:hypothetical protein
MPIHRGRRCQRVWSVTALAAFTLLVGWHTPARNAAPNQNEVSIEFRNAQPGVRYVGSKVCRGCHADIYEQFCRTDMGRSTSLPSMLIEHGWLSEPVDVFNARHKRHYQIFARGPRVFQSEYAVDDAGREIFRHTEELKYVIGTGANGVTPIVRRGDYLFQAPLSYYSAKKAWDLSPNYEMQDLGFSLPVTADCIGCHTGRTQPVLGREGLYKDPPVREMTVSCENCHGPGQIHVDERLAQAPVSGAIDRSIVNPAKIPFWLADNICMNCHEGDIRALQPGKTETDFRPGTPLNDTIVILKPPIDPNSENSPLLEHYYSMTLSRCYQQSAGKFGCQSCHNPHVQPAASAGPEYFRARCLACHTEKSCSLDLQRRLAQQPPDACANCHMPKQPALTVSHSTLTDHRIVRTQDEPYPERAFRASLAGTKFIHVNGIPGKDTRIPLTGLLRAYRQELIRGHLGFKDDYFSLLDQLSKSGSKDGFVLSALAQKALSDGNPTQAVAYATQVVDQGSTSAYDYLLLDSILTRSGNFSAAIRILRQGLLIAPYNNLLYQNLAARQMSAGNISDSLETMRKGLELFPEDAVLRDMQQRATGEAVVH